MSAVSPDLPATIWRIRPVAAVVVLWLGFCAGCVFYGVGANLIMLWLASGAPLLVLTLRGPGDLLARIAAADIGTLLAGWALLFLIVSYQFVTMSPDSSFAASWVFACIPLWYLAYAGLRNRLLLRNVLFVTVVGFALVSDGRFLLTGQRAYEPLADTNNYASLLYLAWIPFAHYMLLSAWRGQLSRYQGCLALCVSFVLLLAVFATVSRVGVVIVSGALLGWLAVAWRRKFSFLPWLVLVACVVLAYAVFLLRSPQLLSAVTSVGEFVAGASVRSSLNTAALEIFRESPVAGTGVFTFPLLYPFFRQTSDQSTAGMFVHNDYLQLLLEGGVWLLIPLAVVAIATGRRLFKVVFSGAGGRHLESFGCVMALAALLAHATVNFVFYVLPVGIAFAVVAAEAFAAQGDPDPAPETGAGFRGAAGWLAGIGFAWAAWAYLALDTVVSGVFAGQPTIAYARQVRADEARMLDFARLAQKLNGKRSVPVLGEAIVLEASLRRDPDSEFLTEAVLDRYRRAVLLDRLNPFVYERLQAFIAEFNSPSLTLRLKPEENPEALLLRAISLDVRRVPTIVTLLEYYDSINRPDLALELLKTRVFPWLELLARTHTEQAVLVITQMRRRADAAEDTEFLARLKGRVAELQGIQPVGLTVWLKAWQDTQFGQLEGS